MTYKLNNGKTIEAETNEELVAKLNQLSLFGNRTSNITFMQDTARACARQNGSKIRTITQDVFVADLIESGFITIVD